MPADTAASSPSASDLQQRNDELSSKLRESELRLALVTDAVAEGIYEWNIETNALWQSQRLRKIFGLAGRELKAGDWNELVHRDDFEGYRSALRDCFRGNSARLDCEYRVKHTDGSYRWLEDRAVAVRNAAGRAVRLVGAVTDVTGRKESEEALREALEQQTATAEVLQVINSSPGDLTPVFNAMLDKAMTLCGAAFGFLTSYDGNRFIPVAMRGVPPTLAAYFAKGMDQPQPGEAHFRILQGEDVIHNLDQKDEEAYRADLPLRRAVVDLGGARTALVVALRKEDEVLGALTIYRKEVRPFADKQIALIRNFAAQAVIAIENARLLSGQREALERQTATAEVLKVINTSPGDLQPVFEAILAKAMTLCEAAFGTLGTFDGRRLNTMATRGVPEAFARFRLSGPPEYGPGTGPARLIAGEDIVHDLDAADSDAYRQGDPSRRAIVDLGGARTILNVALRKDEELLGTLSIYRQEVRPFSDSQIALLQGFAGQAVIAMENARLLTEQREALEQQTATAEVLQVINSSPGDLAPVFDAMLEKAMRLCEAQFGGLSSYDGERFHTLALRGLAPDVAETFREPWVAGSGSYHEDLVCGERLVHADFAANSVARRAQPQSRALAEIGGARTGLLIALRKDDALLGSLWFYRTEVRPFSTKQIALLQNFADQAVIAMENARLIAEQREALEQQTATAEVLQVINSSPGRLEPVFEAMLQKALRLCEADAGFFGTRDGEGFSLAALQGLPPDVARAFAASWRREQGPRHVHAESGAGRIERGEPIVHILDSAGDAVYRSGNPGRRILVDVGGARTQLCAALRKDGVLLGVIIIWRREVRAFTDKQMALLQNFAAQAVIAMENARLLGELRESLEQQTATNEVLSTISRSSVDLPNVLNTLVETVGRLCRTDQAYMFRRREGLHHLIASHGVPDETKEYMLANPHTPNRGNISGRVLMERRTVHIPDVLADPDYIYRQGQKVAGLRTMLGIPLIRGDAILGVFVGSRTHVEPFSDKEIALATGFADQAVIAIENARLFEELRDRQAELRVTFDNMGDGVAMFDAEPRLAAWNQNFEKIIGLPGARLAERPSYEDYLRLLAERGEFGTENVEAELASRLEDTARELRLERTRADGTVIEVRRNAVPGGGFVLIYSDVTERTRAEAAIRSARDDAEAALERQTATADILKVIASSPTDVQPVLEAVAQAAVRFCGATDAVVILRESDEAVVAAHEGPLLMPRGTSFPLNLETASGRAILGGQTCHFPDIPSLDRVEFAANHRIAAAQGFRAAVSAPLLRKGTAIGSVALRKPEVGPFAPQQIALLETFAAQAVIAIENVRLFTELRESLEQQTATAEILTVISQSPTDVGPVLSAVARAAMKFCGASDAQVSLREGDEWFIAAHEGPIEIATTLGARRTLTRHTAPGRAMADGEVVEIVDLQSVDADEFPEGRALGARLGFRSALAAPLLRDDVSIGAISLRRPEAGQFEPRQVELLKTFAAQAVIAIQNVRLFTELKELLEQQTATAEILRVISQSPTDVAPVLEAVARAAVRFCGAEDVAIGLRDGDNWYGAAHVGPIPSSALGNHYPLARQTLMGRAMIDGQTMHAADLQALNPLEFAGARELGELLGLRSALIAPMMRDGMAIGAINLRRRTPGSFAPRQIALLEAFADQAVIAIENVRLFTELRESLERLKAAQANLIQAEKMASLGQLTAGIAHEIKNPLNFVNNFAGLSSELLDELKQAVEVLLAEPDENKRAELQETMDLLTGNLSKIVEHGRRADGIVKSMLAHSRGGTGDWQASNINALVEEALNLAYHGARAQDQDFNVTLERDFALDAQPIEVVPQDVTRVFLNLFGNGFYAAKKRQLSGNGSYYNPTLTVSTRDLGDAVEVRVRDNGTGIQPEVRAKLFQPFFTTKPTGEGTGLGLSISYDIVTQQHGGSIEVESEPGSFTEFTVRLPRRRRAA